jgi:hypothetical protein
MRLAFPSPSKLGVSAFNREDPRVCLSSRRGLCSSLISGQPLEAAVNATNDNEELPSTRANFTTFTVGLLTLGRNPS